MASVTVSSSDTMMTRSRARNQPALPAAPPQVVPEHSAFYLMDDARLHDSTVGFVRNVTTILQNIALAEDHSNDPIEIGDDDMSVDSHSASELPVINVQNAVLLPTGQALRLPPIMIALDSIIPLVKVNSQSAHVRHQFHFNSWLNEAAIDSIVTMRTLPEVVPLAQSVSLLTPCDPSAVAPPAEPTVHHIYLGAGFSTSSLATITDDLIFALRSLSPAQRVVLVVCSGQHWLLLCWRNGEPLMLIDPMASSSVDSNILLLAARLAGDETGLCKVLKSDIETLKRSSRQVSLRSVVLSAQEQGMLSFFSLLNVGVQLEQEDGHNCGLYCALWARQLLERDDPRPVFLPPPVGSRARSQPVSTLYAVAAAHTELCRWEAMHLKALRLRWHLRLLCVTRAPERTEQYFAPLHALKVTTAAAAAAGGACVAFASPPRGRLNTAKPVSQSKSIVSPLSLAPRSSSPIAHQLERFQF